MQLCRKTPLLSSSDYSRDGREKERIAFDSNKKSKCGENNVLNSFHSREANENAMYL